MGLPKILIKYSKQMLEQEFTRHHKLKKKIFIHKLVMSGQWESYFFNYFKVVEIFLAT